MNCKGGYLKFIHRINSNKTDTMLVETGNAKLTIIFGINRNFGNNGINEAGTIAINSDCVSKYIKNKRTEKKESNKSRKMEIKINYSHNSTKSYHNDHNFCYDQVIITILYNDRQYLPCNVGWSF